MAVHCGSALRQFCNKLDRGLSDQIIKTGLECILFSIYLSMVHYTVSNTYLAAWTCAQPPPRILLASRYDLSLWTRGYRHLLCLPMHLPESASGLCIYRSIYQTEMAQILHGNLHLLEFCPSSEAHAAGLFLCMGFFSAYYDSEVEWNC